MASKAFELVDLETGHRLAMEPLTDAQAKALNAQMADADIHRRWFVLPPYGRCESDRMGGAVAAVAEPTDETMQLLNESDR